MVEIVLKAKVQASDGHVGTVGNLVEDESGTVTHFVLEKAHKRAVTLPLSAVDRVEGGTVYLKLDKEAVGKLPDLPQTRSAAKGEADIELVARVFRDPDKDNEQLAREALEFVEDLHRRHTFKILNTALLAKDQDGNVSVVDSRDIDPKKGRLLGAITGGLIGLLAGPGGAIVGALAGLGAGGAAGKLVDLGFSDKFLKNLQEYLQPGSAALILLVEHRWAKSVAESMAGLSGFVFQQPLTDSLVEDLMGASGTEK
jgi:uncharacterized membrane protein